MKPYAGIPGPRNKQSRILGMENAVYVWEHRHSHEVEMPAKGSNRFVNTIGAVANLNVEDMVDHS